MLLPNKALDGPFPQTEGGKLSREYRENPRQKTPGIGSRRGIIAPRNNSVCMCFVRRKEKEQKRVEGWRL